MNRHLARLWITVLLTCTMTCSMNEQMMAFIVAMDACNFHHVHRSPMCSLMAQFVTTSCLRHNAYNPVSVNQVMLNGDQAVDAWA